MPPSSARPPAGSYPRVAIAVMAVALVAACVQTPPRSLAQPPTPTWATFHEPVWGYSIQVPPGWTEIKAGDPHPQQDRDFSNEAVSDAGTLAGLDDKGVLLRIAITPLTAACPRLPEGNTPNYLIVIDGYPATALLFDDGQEFSTEISAMEAQATTDKYCYTFLAMTHSSTTRDSMLSTVDQMLSTFRFGTPVSPPF